MKVEEVVVMTEMEDMTGMEVMTGMEDDVKKERKATLQRRLHEVNLGMDKEAAK
jgi:hypothetical protein